MADGNFLPEADQDFLAAKELSYRLHSESLPNGQVRRAIEFQDRQLPPNLFTKDAEGHLVSGQRVSVLVLVPAGYDEVKLDSWYVDPPAYRQNGEPAQNADSLQILFGKPWQFWSRHLSDEEWRAGIDGFETYLQYVQAGLRSA